MYNPIFDSELFAVCVCICAMVLFSLKDSADTVTSEAKVKFIVSTLFYGSLWMIGSEDSASWTSPLKCAGLLGLIGVFPFSLWVADVSEGLSTWRNIGVLTLVRLPALYFYLLSPPHFDVSILLMVSVVFHGVMIHMQTSFKRMIGYLSCAQFSLVLMAADIGPLSIHTLLIAHGSAFALLYFVTAWASKGPSLHLHHLSRSGDRKALVIFMAVCFLTWPVLPLGLGYTNAVFYSSFIRQGWIADLVVALLFQISTWILICDMMTRLYLWKPRQVV